MRLRKSERLGRDIRQDDWAELGITTWDLLEQAIGRGEKKRALKLLDYLFQEGHAAHCSDNDWWAAMITYIGTNFGETEVEKMWRQILADSVVGPYALTRIESAEERCKNVVEIFRSEQGVEGAIKVFEETDRYVVECACGTGGRMRRAGRHEPPFGFGITSKPYNWSWGRAGVPWYCVHCALPRGIMAIDTCGCPIRVHEFPDDPDKPCRVIFYKKPELIPEKYFIELGMKKDPSKFRIIK